MAVLFRKFKAKYCSGFLMWMHGDGHKTRINVLEGKMNVMRWTDVYKYNAIAISCKLPNMENEDG